MNEPRLLRSMVSAAAGEARADTITTNPVMVRRSKLTLPVRTNIAASLHTPGRFMIYPQRGIGNTFRAVLGAAARFIRVNPLEWLSDMRPSFLSVLIPLYNEEEFIRPLLERVLHAPYPEGVEFEIIVVNDCSTDGSSEAVQDFMRTHPAPIRLVHHEHNQGK